jgi:hypothetical protein
MWAMNELEMPNDDSPRPNLANMPSMDEMLALYEKVLAELDSAISTQRDFSSADKPSNARRRKESSS